MAQLLVKDTKFDFYDDCIQSFNILKKKLTTTPVIISRDWNLDFELMCDASDYVVGVVLGQRIDKKFRLIYYASKIMNDAQEHYTTTEKELLAVVYAFDRFRSSLVMSKTIVYTDHFALKYLFSKQDAKPRLISWLDDEAIRDSFLDEHLMEIQAKEHDEDPWNVDYANFLASREILEHCHKGPARGHYKADITAKKIFKTGFYWPTIFKDAT
ncbi:reverse transcriptase domain-containing protein [Tanacetum coccineum]